MKDKKTEKAEKPVKDQPIKRTSIGGQAVLEGVMMKGARSIATAVRAESGEITVESKYIKSVKEKNVFFRLPFVRGVVNLCSQLFMGTGILMRSAEVYGDFAEPSKFEKKLSAKFKINPMNLLMGVSVVIGMLLAIGLFVFLPNFLTGLLFEIPALQDAHPALQSLFEGALMLIIFVMYVLLVSLMKDIRRVFMYHGAEHKVISCYEHGLDLTVENAKTMSRAHSRCGTTFMFFVIAISIVAFAFVNWGLDALGWLTDNNIVNAFIKLPCKLLFLPIVAGVSYELLKLLAKSDCLFFRILRAPGMLLQRLTTKEPTDDMLEVSITAFKTVMAMDENPNLAEQRFNVKTPYNTARGKIAAIAPSADLADLDWLFCEVTGLKRSELASLAYVDNTQFENAIKIASKMKNGEPLQYALGNTEFYGIKLAVNGSVLIPRPETEMLCERAIAEVNRLSIELIHNDPSRVVPRVLDMCTGSGAVAIAVAKNAACEMTATDISAAALVVARANAITANAKIEFLEGDMFAALRTAESCEVGTVKTADGGAIEVGKAAEVGAIEVGKAADVGVTEKRKFDVVLCNPPYIPTASIKTLDAKVKDFEPMSALDGGSDGLDFYRIIAADISEHLTDCGVLLLEFGIDQAESVKEIFKNYNIEIIKDLEGIDRIALVTKR